LYDFYNVIEKCIISLLTFPSYAALYFPNYFSRNELVVYVATRT